MKRSVAWIAGLVVGLVALVSGATWAYINVVRDDPPARLTLEDASASSTTTASATSAASTTTMDGTWRITSGSTAGYRVKEVLFGQSAEAAGRTSQVTGEFVIRATTVTTGAFSVDMTSVTSDQSRRDGQFRGRIMNTALFPTATFELTRPIDLGSIPADGRKITTKATGNLTLHGTTRPVTINLEAQRADAGIRVAGNLPIVFEEWNIPNPSGGPAQTADNGELEFLLVFAR